VSRHAADERATIKASEVSVIGQSGEDSLAINIMRYLSICYLNYVILKLKLVRDTHAIYLTRATLDHAGTTGAAETVMIHAAQLRNHRK
jgi:hypothetical protein